MMNETLQTIYKRRSVRKYKDIPVNHIILKQVLDAARMAPSAINRQPWKFYLLTDKDQILFFSKAIRQGAVKGILQSGIKKMINTAISALKFPGGANFLNEEDAVFHGAPVVIFITAPQDNEWADIDVGMCAQNMLLAAKSLGLDSCPIGMAKYIVNTDAYHKLSIPEGETIRLAIILGYGDERPTLHPRVQNNIVYIS